MLREDTFGKSDEELFSKLFKENFKKIYFYILSVNKDPEDANEITQEAFMRLWTKGVIKNKEVNHRAWVYRVARNLAMDRFRRLKKRLSFIKSQDYKDIVWEDKEKNEEHQRLFEKLQSIKKKYRTILYLKYYENMSYREIAQIEGIKEGTVMSRLSRAKEALKEVLV